MGSHDFVTLPHSGGGVGDEFLKFLHSLSPALVLLSPAFSPHGRAWQDISPDSLLSTTTLQFLASSPVTLYQCCLTPPHTFRMPASPRTKRERICPWCSQSFSKEDHLARHVRRHTREKPFSCATCTKSFTRYDSLLRHARSHGVYPQSESQKAISAAGEPGQNETPQIHGLSPESVVNSAQGSFPHENSLVAAQSTSDPVVSSPSQADPLPVSFYDWPVDWTSQPSTWLADADFDLNAFNACVITSATPVNDQTLLPLMEPPALVPRSVSIAATSIHERLEDTVRRRWFTFIEGVGSGYDTPGGRPDSIHIDDAYRDNLAQRLQQHITTAPLPSTDFLVCVAQELMAGSVSDSVLEYVYPNVFHSLQRHTSHHPSTHVSPFCEEVSLVAFYLLDGLSFLRF